MITIATLLKNGTILHSDTERLDIELLLAAALGKPVSYLYTWPDLLVNDCQLMRFNSYLERRKLGEPIAYILGKQGFWTFDLKVSSQTLIPRPDTELLVEIGLRYLASNTVLNVADLGVGSGAIALAIASERPLCNVVGVDILHEVVLLAEQNRQQLMLDNVLFMQSNWFSGLAGRVFDVIVSNPPYIPEADFHLQQGDVRFEPLTALVSGKDGLDDIRFIIQQAPIYLSNNGWLFLEHGYDQAQAVTKLFLDRGFSGVFTDKDLGGNERVTGGQWLCS